MMRYNKIDNFKFEEITDSSIVIITITLTWFWVIVKIKIDFYPLFLNINIKSKADKFVDYFFDKFISFKFLLKN